MNEAVLAGATMRSLAGALVIEASGSSVSPLPAVARSREYLAQWRELRPGETHELSSRWADLPTRTLLQKAMQHVVMADSTREGWRLAMADAVIRVAENRLTNRLINLEPWRGTHEVA